MNEELEVVGWVTGFRKIAFTHLMMSHCAMGLAEAKHATDDVLANRPVRLVFRSAAAGDEFRRLARDLGATVAPGATPCA